MRLVAWAVIPMTLAGCSAAADAQEPELPGRTFVSVAVEGAQIPGGGPLTLEFVDDRVSAFAGCNRGSGSVNLSGGHLVVDQLATTMMACAPPFAEADAWLAGLLEAGPAWTLDGDTLTLIGPDATVRMTDRRVLDPDRPIIGTSWRVESLVSDEAVMTSVALEQSKPGLTFREDHTVTGWTGCNTFYGRADVVAQAVTFGPVHTDAAPCSGNVVDVDVGDIDVGAIEASILHVLTGTVQAAVDADRLTLTGADGRGLVLRAE